MSRTNGYKVDRNQYKADLSKKVGNYNKSGEKYTKSEKLMNGVNLWTSFYRSNPHRFCKEYLNINLKPFQAILIYMMFHYIYIMYIAARSQGKTYLTALFCVCKCILYPGTKITVASGSKSQAMKIVTEKIPEIMNCAPNLKREIEKITMSMNTDEPNVVFVNGSWIKVVASNEKARSARSHINIYDEFRIIDSGILTRVLRRFLGTPRQPGYLSKPEYSHLQERNQEIYLSSAWYKTHWSWDKLKTFFMAFVTGKKYFVCGLPYQLSIRENLLMKDQVLDEMQEGDFDPVAWSIEMGALFFGEAEKAYFKLDEIQNVRRIISPLYPRSLCDLVNDKKIKYKEKVKDEIRLLCCDISGIGGKENDASVYEVMQLIPLKNGYERQITYMETMTGGHTETQALKIRSMFEDFECDYIILDRANMGLGVYDALCGYLHDKEKDIQYEPLMSMNESKMQERCEYKEAEKLIYTISASEDFNSEIATSLRDMIKRRKLKLLVSESESNDFLFGIKNYAKLPTEIQAELRLPFRQIDSLVNETVNLEGEFTSGGKLKVKEQKGKRKDRYSATAYGNYFANVLEKRLVKKEKTFNWMKFIHY